MLATLGLNTVQSQVSVPGFSPRSQSQVSVPGLSPRSQSQVSVPGFSPRFQSQVFPTVQLLTQQSVQCRDAEYIHLAAKCLLTHIDISSFKEPHDVFFRALKRKISKVDSIRWFCWQTTSIHLWSRGGSWSTWKNAPIKQLLSWLLIRPLRGDFCTRGRPTLKHSNGTRGPVAILLNLF